MHIRINCSFSSESSVAANNEWTQFIRPLFVYFLYDARPDLVLISSIFLVQGRTTGLAGAFPKK